MTYFRQNNIMFAVSLIIYCYVGVITAVTYSISTSSDNFVNDIVYYNYTSDDHGNYNFSFKSIDIEREESGQVINVGQPDQYIRVTGKYSYNEITEDEDILKIYYYTADKDGYRIDHTETISTPTNFYKIDNLDVLKTLIGG